MEITEATRGIFNLNRVLGLAPYMIQKNPSSGKVEIKRSIFLCIYSFSLLVILGFSTYWGLFRMTDLKAPARTISKVVTVMDVSVVAIATFMGMICGLIGLRPTLDTNRRLKEVDEELSAYTNEVKDRFRAYMIMSPTLLFLTFLIDEPQPEEGLGVRWYLPFYSLYYILTALHINFAQSAMGLGRRYSRLNMALKRSFLEDAKFGDGVIPVAVVRNVAASKSLDVLSSIQETQRKVSQRTKQSLINGSGALMDRLAHIHASLGQCIRNTSGAFGMAVLFLMISCLLHLVATAYFLLQGVLETINGKFFCLQSIWIIFHSLLLVLIVEPCHVTTEEMRKFWLQLLSEKAGFSACGMCKIDRQILTSFSSAITTYLVILIQFQQSTKDSKCHQG